jgi:hypothetical protein
MGFCLCVLACHCPTTFDAAGESESVESTAAGVVLPALIEPSRERRRLRGRREGETL